MNRKKPDASLTRNKAHMSSFRRFICLFSVAPALLSCEVFYDPDDYQVGGEDGPNVADVLILDISANSLPADGASKAKITISIASDADSDKRSVALSSTAGKFDVSASSTAILHADSRSKALTFFGAENKESTAIITASIGNVVVLDTIRFRRAYPDSISLDLGTFALKASLNENTTVTANLIRKTGKPTLGTEVSFSAFDSTKSRIGQFRSIEVSNAQGEATAVFSAGNTQYRGKIEIRAVVETPDGRVSGVDALTITSQ